MLTASAPAERPASPRRSTSSPRKCSPPWDCAASTPSPRSTIICWRCEADQTLSSSPRTRGPIRRGPSVRRCGGCLPSTTDICGYGSPRQVRNCAQGGDDPLRELSRTPSHRRGDAVAADIDAGRFQRAVVLLHRAEDDDLGARLQFGLVAGDEGDDRRTLRHQDLLLAVLVLDQDVLAV